MVGSRGEPRQSSYLGQGLCRVIPQKGVEVEKTRRTHEHVHPKLIFTEGGQERIDLHL